MMKPAATLVLIALAATAMAQDHQRAGYVRRDGVYVPPSYATNPNDTLMDNYSTKGTVDPYKLEQPRLAEPDLYGNPKKRGY